MLTSRIVVINVKGEKGPHADARCDFCMTSNARSEFAQILPFMTLRNNVRLATLHISYIMTLLNAQHARAASAQFAS
jgi:hypothetical protein